MVLKRSASFKRSDNKPQINLLTKLNQRRTSFGAFASRSRKASPSLSSSSSASNSLSKWHQLDNPLIAATLKGFKLEQKNKSKLNLSRRRRRRRRESSKNSESNDDTNTDTERELESCFDSFLDLDVEDYYILHTKSGDEVKVKFGHDYVSVDGQLILYEHIIYWGHTKRCLKISYVENMSTAEQERVEISLYPSTLDSITAGDLAHILQTKVAALYKEITGCSEDEALDVATKQAQKAEVAHVLNHVDKSSEHQFAQSFA